MEKLKLSVGFNKILVKQHPVKKEMFSFMVNEDGRDFSADGTVIAVGYNLKDIKPGDIITYQRSRGQKIFIDNGGTSEEYYIVDYNSMYYFKANKN